jgi:hypothetical protein
MPYAELIVSGRKRIELRKWNRLKGGKEGLATLTVSMCLDAVDGNRGSICFFKSGFKCGCFSHDVRAFF